MPINQACLKAKGLCDRNKAAFLLRDLLSFGVDGAVNKESHFATSMLMYCLVDFVAYSAYMDLADEA